MKVKIFKPSSWVYKISFWLFRKRNKCNKCEHKKLSEVCYLVYNQCLKGEL